MAIAIDLVSNVCCQHELSSMATLATQVSTCGSPTLSSQEDTNQTKQNFSWCYGRWPAHVSRWALPRLLKSTLSIAIVSQQIAVQRPRARWSGWTWSFHTPRCTPRQHRYKKLQKKLQWTFNFEETIGSTVIYSVLNPLFEDPLVPDLSEDIKSTSKTWIMHHLIRCSPSTHSQVLNHHPRDSIKSNQSTSAFNIRSKPSKG